MNDYYYCYIKNETTKYQTKICKKKKEIRRKNKGIMSTSYYKREMMIINSYRADREGESKSNKIKKK